MFGHFYETSEIGCPKHYLAHGHHVWTDQTGFDADNQHEDITVLEGLPTNLHEYVEDYLEAASIEGSPVHSR